MRIASIAPLILVLLVACANVSLAPCGLVLSGSDGDYTLDFGFQVNDRFVSVTPNWRSGSAVIPIVSFPLANEVRVQTYSGGTTLVDSAFSILVY